MRRTSLLVLLACFATLAQAETLHGRVIDIIDGDTLRVDVAGRGTLIVHLAWIAAPDRLQEHGEAARSSLNALAGQRPVRLETVGGESKGALRVTAWAAPESCRSGDCPPTLDLGLTQVARGMAWHDRRTLGQSQQSFGAYQQAEFQAKIRRLGLWSAKNPTPPWDWRRR